MKRATIILTAAVGLLLASASSASAAIDCSNVRDTFNSANIATLGSSWTQQAPTTSIEGQRATNPNLTTGLSTFNGGTGNAACADVTVNGTGGQYVAIVLNFAGPNDNLFIKVQENTGGGAFDTVFFYHGNNGTAFAPVQAITPFTSGRFAVSRSGDNVTVDIDTNFDGVPEQEYTRTGANSVPNLGTGIGLGLYGHDFADNFATSAATPSPSPAPVTKKKCKKKKHRAASAKKKCKKKH
jgi:hypothetical protein